MCLAPSDREPERVRLPSLPVARTRLSTASTGSIERPCRGPHPARQPVLIRRRLVMQRWSTADAPPAAQFTRWRELICEAFLDLTPESDLRDGFAGTVTQWPLGAMSIARIDSQRQQVRRTARDIARAPLPGFYANLQVRGTSRMTQHGRSTVLRPGDLAVVDTTEPFRFDFRDDFQQLSLFVPRSLFEWQLGSPVRTATRVGTTTGAGAAVRHALLTLTRGTLPDDTAAR